MRLAVLASVSVLAACQIVPKTAPAPPPPPPRPVETAPQDGVLPSDLQRHRIALLVPMSGPNAATGQAIANATTMALLDTNAQNLRITTYDTSAGAGQAAAHAVADGNKLILGPLLSEDVIAVASVARPARVPMITYSNDTGVASHDVFVLGTAPSQSVARVVGFARASGVKRIAGLIPTGIFGQRTSTALVASAREEGLAVAGVETYDRSNTSIGGAVHRLTERADFDAVLIADGPRLSMQAAPLVGGGHHILGTELWAGDVALTRSPALRGAWFAALSDARFPRYSATYKTRFGAAPPRIS
ncbi:MAG: penicillin-binding protein activator, partial [Novosphingobium sp.]|nr:penicillin-binding protein activator [Novosphingobium sp.]